MDDWPEERFNKVTSPATPDYNCVAWLVRDQKRWWWPPGPDPVTTSGSYWPEGLPTDESIETFVALFNSWGYERCESAGWDAAYERIALYVDEADIPTHVARQLRWDPGPWTSKYGDLTDCEHALPEHAECPRYGRVHSFYHRATAPPTGG